MNSIEIEINNQFSRLKDPEDRTEAICAILADSKFKLDPGTLSIAFVDEDSIKKLHATFLGDPSSTDVITFPKNRSFESAGEICISIDEAIKNSNSLGTTISDEITLYLIHGWLHLCGFDDKNEETIKEMRQAENDALNLLEQSAPLPNYQVN